MEGLLIALLIAALSSVFGGKNKASQRKRPSNAKPIDKPISGSSKTNVKSKQKPAADYSISYISTEPVIEKIQQDNTKHEVADIENEDILDKGLSDMQRAIVMAEILDKPLALRKK